MLGRLLILNPGAEQLLARYFHHSSAFDGSRCGQRGSLRVSRCDYLGALVCLQLFQENAQCRAAVGDDT